MPSVDLPLVDCWRMERYAQRLTVPSLAEWQDLFLQARHAKFVYFGSTAKMTSSVAWNDAGVRWWRWLEDGISFCLPVFPVGIYDAAFVVKWDTVSYDSYLGRPVWDLGSRSRAKHNLVQVMETPLWRTWPRGCRLQIWPLELRPVPSALPTFGNGHRYWSCTLQALRCWY